MNDKTIFEKETNCFHRHALTIIEIVFTDRDFTTSFFFFQTPNQVLAIIFKMVSMPQIVPTPLITNVSRSGLKICIFNMKCIMSGMELLFLGSIVLGSIEKEG